MLLWQRNDLIERARQMLRRAAGERKREPIYRNTLPGHGRGELVTPAVISARQRGPGAPLTSVAPGHSSRST